MAAKNTPAAQVTQLPERSAPAPDEGAVAIATEQGTTHIQPHVVAKIAGIAVREVAGVQELVPYNAGQTLTSFARSIRGAQMREMGVSVEVGTIEAAVDVRVITRYGSSIPQIAVGIRENVTRRIFDMTGLSVTEINIEVVDLWFEEDVAVPAPSPVTNERQLR